MDIIYRWVCQTKDGIYKEIERGYIFNQSIRHIDNFPFGECMDESKAELEAEGNYVSIVLKKIEIG